jgi:hypothetical protein
MGDHRYWDIRVKNRWDSIAMAEEQLKKPSGDPTYRAEYLWGLTQDYTRQTLTQYSRGDGIAALYNPFPKVLDAWELSNREAEFIEREYKPEHIRAWVFRLDCLEHYNWCFWLVGLAFIFDIPDDQWMRLVTLVGGEGEDELLDRIIATRQTDRRIGGNLLHGLPYARLLKAVNAKPHQQAALLKDFVDHWYLELKRPIGMRIWWYDYGNPEVNPLEKGSYFGRWCVEAVAAVKAFGLDDSLCLGHGHYPGNLLRPDKLSTQPAQRPAWVRNLLGVLAFFLVWAFFPNTWLVNAGAHVGWVGAAKVIAACLASWLTVSWLGPGRHARAERFISGRE